MPQKLNGKSSRERARNLNITISLRCKELEQNKLSFIEKKLKRNSSRKGSVQTYLLSANTQRVHQNRKRARRLTKG